MLSLLSLALVPPAMGHGATTSDAEDGSGIAHVAHEDVGGVVRYTVTTFEPVRQDGVTLMRWDLDLDGDGRTAGRDDGCILLRPVKGRRVLHADLYDGCNGDPVAGADVRAKGNTLKLRFLLEEMRDAGLADGAASYGYRFRFVDRNGTTDDVPDAPGALITHAIGKAGGTSKEKAASTPKTSAPERSETPSSSSDVVVGQQRAESSRGGAAVAAEAKDTKSTGNANEEVVEAGDDVEISGSGFGRNQALTITLVGGAATSTATPAPSPSASPSASPTPTASPTPAARAQTAQAADYRAASLRTGTVVLAARQAAAAQAEGTRLGIGVSEADGSFEDDVDIPETTKPGSYTVAVEGRNSSGGTHTVNIPIRVAADVNGNGDDATSGQVSNATGTATQASPTAAAGGGTGNALPTTGSSHLMLLAGLGALGVVLGSSLLFARRIAHAPAGSGPSALPIEMPLRGEMQRLLALRADRHDPDRDAHL